MHLLILYSEFARSNHYAFIMFPTVSTRLSSKECIPAQLLEHIKHTHIMKTILHCSNVSSGVRSGMVNVEQMRASIEKIWEKNHTRFKNSLGSTMPNLCSPPSNEIIASSLWTKQSTRYFCSLGFMQDDAFLSSLFTVSRREAIGMKRRILYHDRPKTYMHDAVDEWRVLPRYHNCSLVEAAREEGEQDERHH